MWLGILLWSGNIFCGWALFFGGAFFGGWEFFVVGNSSLVETGHYGVDTDCT